jgi:hypothetical protein
VINDAVVELPWETRWESPLEVGPRNDYLEVIDFDPSSGVFYAPVDLNNPALLAQDGLPPSEGRPQFHQQMVFAVAMRTIRAFERALGRGVLWAGDRAKVEGDEKLRPIERSFTKRLRIYPHALREANAYYSPQKRALLFGYFRPDPHAGDVDASWVFTCLSQDIIAHETAHAILHGLQQRSIEPSNIDALAFHEAFADVVALLQHFSMEKVVRQELASSRGSLRELGLLTGLADQFGRATGRSGALRYALDLLHREAADRSTQKASPTAPKQPAVPEETISQRKEATDVKGDKVGEDALGEAAVRKRLRTTTEPHARGGFLVAAVFDAFVTIYERRAADLFRLARTSRGQSDAAADLPPELVNRLAIEAAKAADHVLRMCVRALDYIPPVDMHFGEYLRAIITADTDLIRDDPLRYRVAFIEAFKKREITVPGCLSMAPDSLLWGPPNLSECPSFVVKAGHAPDAVSAMFAGLLQQLQLTVAFSGSKESSSGDGTVEPVAFQQKDFREGEHRNLRDLSMQVVLHNQRIIHKWFFDETPGDEDWEWLLGIRLLPPEHRYRTRKVEPLGSITTQWDREANKPTDVPLFEVHSARIARRAGPNGEEAHQLIIQMTQRRRAYFDTKEQEAADAGQMEEIGDARWKNPDFWFRGGATIHVDLRDGRLLRIIRKRIDNESRLEAERRFRSGDETGLAMVAGDAAEPFAFMHRSVP